MVVAGWWLASVAGSALMAPMALSGALSEVVPAPVPPRGVVAEVLSGARAPEVAAVREVALPAPETAT